MVSQRKINQCLSEQKVPFYLHGIKILATQTSSMFRGTHIPKRFCFQPLNICRSSKLSVFPGSFPMSDMPIMKACITERAI